MDYDKLTRGMKGSICIGLFDIDQLLSTNLLS